jgi:hypothetical protein
VTATLRIGNFIETPSIRHPAPARCARREVQEENVKASPTTQLSRRATRWWSAPARFTAASLALLRRASLRRERDSLENDPWVRQTPVGIRVP